MGTFEAVLYQLLGGWHTSQEGVYNAWWKSTWSRVGVRACRTRKNQRRAIVSFEAVLYWLSGGGGGGSWEGVCNALRKSTWSVVGLHPCRTRKHQRLWEQRESFEAALYRQWWGGGGAGTCFNFHSFRGGGGGLPPDPLPPPPSAQVHLKTWVLGTFLSHGKKCSAPSTHAIYCVRVAPRVLHISCLADHHAPTLSVSVFQLPGPTVATCKMRRRN